MASISVCVPIFNNVGNFITLYSSLLGTPNQNEIEYILYNDGSTKLGLDAECQSFCAANGIRYLSSPKNRGVAASWNALCNAASSDIIALLNDDVRAGQNDWAGQIISSFADNPRLGIVYWCQMLVDPASGEARGLTTNSLLPLETNLPLIRHNFCGAFFAFRKSIWQDIRQPDGSTGFWEDMISYGEEFDFSAEAQSRGYFILQLPFTWEHLHSQTFTANPGARQRRISAYLSGHEFGIRQSFLRKMANIFLAPEQATVPTGQYGAAMLAKKWRAQTILGVEAPEFFRQMRIDGFPLALASAIESNSFELPKHIVWQGRSFAAEQLIDKSGASLI